MKNWVVNCEALWAPQGVALTHWGHIAGKLAELHGLTLPLIRPLLIGLRGAKGLAMQTHQPVHRAAYDDTFVLFQPPAERHVFVGSTTAYQPNSKKSPDVTGDGVGDVGSIRPGAYVLHYARGQALGPIFHLKTRDGSERIPCYRDTDHDGVISEAEEKRALEARGVAQSNSDGLYATAVLFHPGYTSGRSSIACQTAHVSKLDLLVRAGETLDYILADAPDVVPFAEEAKALYWPEPTKDASRV